jgi:hypothetical protein
MIAFDTWSNRLREVRSLATGKRVLHDLAAYAGGSIDKSELRSALLKTKSEKEVPPFVSLHRGLSIADRARFECRHLTVIVVDRQYQRCTILSCFACCKSEAVTQVDDIIGEMKDAEIDFARFKALLAPAPQPTPKVVSV